MTRTNQILALTLIVQIIIGIVLFVPGDSDTSRAAGPLLADFEPNQVVKVTVQDGTDTLMLHKTDEDGWVLPEKDSYPALNHRVQQLLDNLETLDRNRLIARQPSSHEQLGVSEDEYERRIDVEFSEGDTRTIYLGTSAGAGTAHVRVEDEDNVYLARGLSAWEVPVRPTSWVDTTYFAVARDNIVALEIENPNGVFRLQKQDDESWTLADLAEDETFDPESITSLLGNVSRVRLNEPLGKEADPAWGMDEPAVTITLTVAEPVTPTATDDATDAPLDTLDDVLPGTTSEATETSPAPETSEDSEGEDVQDDSATETVEKTYTLKLGQQLDDNTYPLISSESEFYVKVAASTAENFLDLAREDLLVEPEPEATATPEDDATE